jgi:hypothetical protein
MNQKEYSNKNRFHKGLEEIGKDVAPLFKRLFRAVKTFVLAHPNKTAIIMFMVIVLNIAVLLVSIYRKENSLQANGYSAVMKNLKNKKLSLATNETTNQSGIGSFFEMRKIRDSLQYLMNKTISTKEDTLCFIRLYKRYSLIDPSIADALKEINNKKQDSIHLKIK